MNRFDMSAMEIQSTWLSRLDLKKIKDESKRIVEKNIYGIRGYCLRGLEGKLNDNLRLRKKYTKENVRMAVFQKQFNQRVQKYSNPEEIASASCKYSNECKEQARRLGHQDEKDALYILHFDLQEEKECDANTQNVMIANPCGLDLKALVYFN